MTWLWDTGAPSLVAQFLVVPCRMRSQQNTQHVDANTETEHQYFKIQGNHIKPQNASNRSGQRFAIQN
jgi:hypothetical protein